MKEPCHNDNRDAEKESRGKLAVCIPTYKRSGIVKGFLKQSSSLFNQLGIDIYYYDSSEDDKTRFIVQQWSTEYGNIHYVHVDSGWHANYKVIHILKEQALAQKYEYLWVCGDAILCPEWMIRQILDWLVHEYDMVIVDGTGIGAFETREYRDGNELFQEHAWYTTLLGAVILNVHSMLMDVPWDYIEEVYEIPERINYAHVGFYFEMISRLDSFRALYLAVNQEIRQSQRIIRSGWYKDAFKVMCEYWPSTIKALPSWYTNKDAAIHKLGLAGCLSPMTILEYRKEGVYNWRVVLRYRDILKRMSGLTGLQLWSMAWIHPKLAYYIGVGDITGFVGALQTIRRLHGFCEQYDTIYIYGAGMKAKLYGSYLHRKGIIFAGFLVTQRKGNPGNLLGRPVMEFSCFKEEGKKAGIILGLERQNLREIQPFLMEQNVWKYTFHEYIMPLMLEDWRKRAE